MDRTKSERIKLGVFVIIGTALIIIAAYVIGNRQNLFGNSFELSTNFKNVNGLQVGNNVRFSGINVGTVHAIEMINDTTIKVRMVISNDIQGHIKKDAIATVGSDGLVGSMIVNILPGKGNAAYVEAGDQIQSFSRIATEDMLSTLSVTNENAALLTAELLKVTESLIEGKGAVGMLLNDTTVANDLKYTLESLKQISMEAKSIVQEINGMVNSEEFDESPLGLVLGDTASGRKVKRFIQNLETSSAEIDKITRELNTIVKRIKEGDGAVNYLINDSTFVQQLDTSMRNVVEGTERFNENMEALKQNFLFRGYFKKQERKKSK